MSLIRRDHIAGHTHDRSRSSSIDGEIDYSTWTLEKVLQWLDDNCFSEYKQIFIGNYIYIYIFIYILLFLQLLIKRSASLKKIKIKTFYL